MLKRADVIVEWCDNGFDALERLKEGEVFDIVLLDIKLPKMDGFEVFDKIRELQPDLKIIAQTAYGKIEDEINIRNHGFNDFISKPIKPDNFYRVINRFLS